MNATIINRIEIIFWDLTIIAMTESRVVQSVIRRAYRAYRLNEVRNTAILVTFAAGMGLLGGVALNLVGRLAH